MICSYNASLSSAHDLDNYMTFSITNILITPSLTPSVFSVEVKTKLLLSSYLPTSSETVQTDEHYDVMNTMDHLPVVSAYSMPGVFFFLTNSPQRCIVHKQNKVHPLVQLESTL